MTHAHTKSQSRQLFYGDNLDILRKFVPSESIDLCYIDPPFKSDRNYNQIYNRINDDGDLAQAQAFVDTWTWDTQAEEGLQEIRDNSPLRRGEPPPFPHRTIALISGLEQVLGKGSLLAYLVSMSLRIIEIHRVLKPTGSFYLHCDPTASHYLKLICDTTFNGNFLSEIIWRRTGSHNKCDRWAPIHDVLLFYSKSDKHTWNYPKQRYMRGHVEQFFQEDDQGLKTAYYGNVLTGSGVRTGESGMEWKGINPTAKGRHWAIPSKLWEDSGIDPEGLSQHQKLDRLFEVGLIKIIEGQFWPIYERRIRPDDGPAMSDIWAYQPYTAGTVYATESGIDEDVSWMKPRAAERQNFQTQKPEGLLERIIKASSNEGDTILDAYCGCGTTIAVAEHLNRNWVGIDITYQSISLIIKRLGDAYGNSVSDNVSLSGAPKDLKSAIDLATNKNDRLRKDFEKWAIITFTDNYGVINDKKGADRGIDGHVKFLTGYNEEASMILQVKSGKVSVRDIRDLRGVLEREKAAMATLITLDSPSKPMITEAKIAGTYFVETMKQKCDRIQIVTVQDIIEHGNRFNLPLPLDAAKSASRINKHTGKEQKLKFDAQEA